MNYIESASKLIIVGAILYFASQFVTLHQFITFIAKVAR